MGYIVCMDAYGLQDIYWQVFEAAHKGDVATVESLLLQHSLSPDLAKTVSNIVTLRCMHGYSIIAECFLYVNNNSSHISLVPRPCAAFHHLQYDKMLGGGLGMRLSHSAVHFYFHCFF